MFSKNLKYYRLRNNMTKAALAEKAGITSMAITHYENGDRHPDMATIKALADVLGIRKTDFLRRWNENLVFTHEEFRKNSRLTKSQQEYIRASVEEYFNRFYDVLEILGGEVLPDAPEMDSIALLDDVEENARKLRAYLKISESGPVGGLIELLENRGVLIFKLDIDNDSFSGMNGTVNGRPYIVLNKNMTAERIRTTICHELAHLAFKWPCDMAEKDAEKMATAIAGAFLFPKEDAIRELGIRRKAVTTDMYMVCEEYGISMSLLVVRAHICGIISESVYKGYFINNNSRQEESRIDSEETALFEQLAYRAINEGDINIQKGAELLRISYDEVSKHCSVAV
ncbi:MAG: XRE family transcriptional regulator [Oribacterium sp.]|nr:XRE family transcriptional regulator [Oribacterium sp.]